MSTQLWNNQCCCGGSGGCCWDQCDWSTPPTNCLDGIPSAQWILIQEEGFYAAFIPGEYFVVVLLSIEFSNTCRKAGS